MLSRYQMTYYIGRLSLSGSMAFRYSIQPPNMIRELIHLDLPLPKSILGRITADSGRAVGEQVSDRD